MVMQSKKALSIPRKILKHFYEPKASLPSMGDETDENKLN